MDNSNIKSPNLATSSPSSNRSIYSQIIKSINISYLCHKELEDLKLIDINV